jgi:CelD/BcsL family acetyltransferase involved in cellulose biosynthesis
LKANSGLQQKWQALYEHSDSSVFTSWNWIAAWIDSIPGNILVLEATNEERSLGLGLFCANAKSTMFGLTVKQLWLHKKGNKKYDQIWTECNDFLLDTKLQSVVRDKMINYLIEQKELWNELYIGLSNPNVIRTFEEKIATKRVDINSNSFEVNLANKASVEDYLQELSKNTRKQILRSKKLLEGEGELLLKFAATDTEKQQYFSDIASIHIDKWGDTEFGSGFSNDIFNVFHKNIIFNENNTDYCRLYQLALNDNPLAYIYIIKDKSVWNFYLSAIKTHPDNRIKVGLLAHTLVIEQAILNNALSYNFLAGEARYKRSMSNVPESNQQLVCFYRPTLIIRIRECLRMLKNIFSSKYLSLAKSSNP